MVIDTSALLALLQMEPRAEAIADAVEADAVRLVSAATLLEASIVMAARHGDAGVRLLDRLVEQADVEVVPVTAEHARLGLEAFERFGKGRHPAALNYGDCFSYALARASGESLLCLGEDFPRTDLDRVPLP